MRLWKLRLPQTSGQGQGQPGGSLLSPRVVEPVVALERHRHSMEVVAWRRLGNETGS